MSAPLPPGLPPPFPPPMVLPPPLPPTMRPLVPPPGSTTTAATAPPLVLLVPRDDIVTEENPAVSTTPIRPEPSAEISPDCGPPAEVPGVSSSSSVVFPRGEELPFPGGDVPLSLRETGVLSSDSSEVETFFQLLIDGGSTSDLFEFLKTMLAWVCCVRRTSFTSCYILDERVRERR